MRNPHDGLIGERLAALPALEPPAGAFAGALARAAAASSRHQPGLGWTLAAAAATAVLAIAVLVRSAPGTGGAATSSATAAPPAELLAESARLESELAALPAQRARRAGTAYTISLIEDRLALVDDELSALALEPGVADVAEGLWRERVALMDSLVRVRYAETLTDR